MKAKSSSILLLLSLSVLLNLGFADLPIHCLKHQVAGDWKLEIDTPVQNSKQMSCGHETPDNPAKSYLSLRKEFQPTTEFLVSLDGESQALMNPGANGQWTMIYDEGFDINVGEHRFTAFFEYYPNEQGRVMSYCGKTLVGWYHNSNSGQKACFRAEKVVQDEAERKVLLGEPLEQMHVVQPEEPELLQIKSSTRMSKMAKSQNYPNMKKDFDDHEAAATKLNQISDKLWTATAHPKFEGKTLADLNNLAGRKKFISEDQKHRHSLRNSFIQKSDVSDLPKSFSWKEKLNPPREQGDCGSCYVLSTIQMLEARLKIKYNKDVKLSPQHVLDCSFYNQGCDGGYPFLVEKFANEFDLVPESCHPYTGSRGSCNRCDASKLPETYGATNYK